MTVRRLLTSGAGIVLGALVTVLSLAAPAGAQQLVDAGKQGDGSGGLAFALFFVMAAVIAASLFYMDHVRRSRLHEDDDTS